MKAKHSKKEIKKFGLEKFEIAKLKNLIVIKGGAYGDDPIETNNGKAGSSRGCGG